MTDPLDELRPLVRELRAGRPLCVLTGAGISVESGLPTFRGPGGLWEGSRPEDLATPEAFEADPERVWRWYEWRRALVREALPNDGHLALARLERLLPRVTLVTQNVDGLHGAAGSRGYLELHGSIRRTRCTRDGSRHEAPDRPFASLPPRCACGALLRPDVVWFGEALDPETWAAAVAAAASCAVFLVVGTSSVVAPASTLGLEAVREGAALFEVNPEPTALAPLATGVFEESAAVALPRIAAAVASGA